MPIYINSRVYYRIDTVIQKGDAYKVWIRTKVEMHKAGSFWDKTKVRPESEKVMLEHEQGHYYLAHIAGNNLEKEMPKFKFTENWKEEVRSKFHELNRKYGAEFDAYDKETDHGRNKKAQAKWNKMIEKKLK